MEEMKTMDFGKKYQVGNYHVLKYNKALRKSEAASLSTQVGIPVGVRKGLEGRMLPFIKVFIDSGIWSIEFSCNTTVFKMLDALVCDGGKNSIAMLNHLFNMWFMDTTVPGDEEYQKDKAEAFKRFMERQKAADGVKAEVVDMKGGSHESE